jgi:hypothetical protein
MAGSTWDLRILAEGRAQRADQCIALGRAQGHGRGDVGGDDSAVGLDEAFERRDDRRQRRGAPIAGDDPQEANGGVGKTGPPRDGRQAARLVLSGEPRGGQEEAQVPALGDHGLEGFQVGLDGVEVTGFQAKIEQRPGVSRAYIARSGIVSQVQPPTVSLSRQRRREVQFRPKDLKALNERARTRKAGIPPRRKPRA